MTVTHLALSMQFGDRSRQISSRRASSTKQDLLITQESPSGMARCGNFHIRPAIGCRMRYPDPDRMYMRWAHQVIAHRTMDGGVGVWNKRRILRCKHRRPHWRVDESAPYVRRWQRRASGAQSGVWRMETHLSDVLGCVTSSIWAVAGDIWLLGPNSLVRYVSLGLVTDVCQGQDSPNHP